MKRFVTALLVSGLLAASCGTVGSGTVISEERNLSGFDRVDVSGAMDADITVTSNGGFSVTVRADDNLMDQIEVDVDGDTLEIAFEGSVVNPTEKVVIVSMPALVEIDASGASNVLARGEADDLVIKASGASDVEAGDLTAATVRVDASGASDVTIFATTSVTGDASGASNIDILGNPGSVDVDTSGASDVDF